MAQGTITEADIRVITTRLEIVEHKLGIRSEPPGDFDSPNLYLEATALELEAENRQLTQQLQAMKAKIDGLEHTNRSYSDHNDELREGIERYKNQINDLEAIHANAANVIKCLQLEIEGLKAQHEAYRGTVQTYVKDLSFDVNRFKDKLHAGVITIQDALSEMDDTIETALIPDTNEAKRAGIEVDDDKKP
jgi:chromosome segregation ATPase